MTRKAWAATARARLAPAAFRCANGGHQRLEAGGVAAVLIGGELGGQARLQGVHRLLDRRLRGATRQPLAENGRISWRDLAERVGLSLTPVLRRVRRLEEHGFITGYSARFDETRLGAAFSVFVQVTLERQAEEALEAFESRIIQAPEVMSCYLMSGGSDYLLRVVAADLGSYQAFMTGVLTRIPGVARIQSSFALKPDIERSAPPLR